MLITGASGFTGTHACAHFLKAGFELTAVTRKNTPANHQVQFVHCDLTDKEAARNLIKRVKPQYFLHLAGQNHVGQSWMDPISTLEVNSISTLYLIEAIRQEIPTCKTVVVGSALQFDPNDLSALSHPYSLSKTLQVIIAQSWQVLYDMHVVIAKPSNLIGPGFSNGVCSIFAKKIVDMESNKSERILEVNNLNALRDYIDVRDAVSAYELLLTKGNSGEIFEIALGKKRSLEEVINGFRSFTTTQFEIKSLLNEQEEQQVGITPLKLIELGWKPSISFESSLSDILTFYRRNQGYVN